ncbi:MAG: hydrogenase maturation nickel metallochaperone HypA [Candidatus Diapherotrites archaeon]|nr:hydrogenase maturation nickel metallochaperone HypA [Candidatus Diapherotrites archaeon]
MHEFGIVSKIFDEIQATGKTKRAVVRLGALKSVDPAVFKEMFASIARGTPLEDMKVEIETVPLIIKCPKCGFKGEIQDIPHLHTVFLSWPCPKCGAEADILSGNEQEIVEVE